MIGAPGAQIPKPELPGWKKIFVQSRHYGARHLEAGTQVLYEV